MPSCDVVRFCMDKSGEREHVIDINVVKMKLFQELSFCAKK
jgi:hypothetical protein